MFEIFGFSEDKGWWKVLEMFLRFDEIFGESMGFVTCSSRTFL